MLADFPVQQPGYHTDSWVGPMFSLAVLFAVVAVVTFLADRLAECRHRAELAATEERERAKLAAATVPLVVERRDTCAAETTGVITMPPALFRSGRHAAPSLVGAARVPLNMSCRLLSSVRDGWFRA